MWCGGCGELGDGGKLTTAGGAKLGGPDTLELKRSSPRGPFKRVSLPSAKLVASFSFHFVSFRCLFAGLSAHARMRASRRCIALCCIACGVHCVCVRVLGATL